MIDPALLQLLRCPDHPDAGILTLAIGEGEKIDSRQKELACQFCHKRYPIRDGIPDMVHDGSNPHSYRAGEMKQWDEQAEIYDAKRMGDLVYRAGIEAASEALASRDGDWILDAGCGTGLTIKTYYRPNLRIVALDLSLESLKYLRKTFDHPSIYYVKGDLTKLPFGSNVFDKVLCANTITQLPNEELRQRSLHELTRVALARGRVVVTAHNLSVPKKRQGLTKEGSGKAYGIPYQYVYRFDSGEFRSFLGSSLQVDLIRGAGLPLPYRLKLSPLSRCLERLLRRFPTSSPWGNMLVGVGHKRE